MPSSPTLPADAGPRPDGAPPRDEGADRTAVWRYLRMLGADAEEADELAQETLLAALRGGLPWQDVAAQLGMKPNGTKPLVQRAREALRHCIERSEA